MSDQGSAAAGADARRAEVGSKLAAVRSLLGRRGFEAAALSSRRNFAWLTGGGDSHVVRAGDAGVATILVTADGAVVLTPVNEAARILEEEIGGLGMEVVALPWEDPTALEREIASRTVAPPPSRASGSGRARVEAMRPVAPTVADDAALEADLRHLRSRLSEVEIDRLAAVAADASRAMTATINAARPGETEAVVAARLAVALADAGMSAPVLLAASDERIVRYRHPIPKPKPIERSLMLVVVAERGGLHAALTRMAWLRGRPDEETLRRYRACARIDTALREATVPGRSLAGILAAGIGAYGQEGFPDEWRLHHQGGTIGYAPRETIATPDGTEIAEDGMAFAFNPSITGAKAEETFALRRDGTREVLTHDPAWPLDADGRPAILVRD
jgi:antitoxin VapB